MPAVVGVVRDLPCSPYVPCVRSSADHPDYKPRYFGDHRARDAAYHQAPSGRGSSARSIDAWLKVHPGDRAGARQLLEPLVEHLNDAGLCSNHEISTPRPPIPPARVHRAGLERGPKCCALWKKTKLDTAPAQTPPPR